MGIFTRGTYTVPFTEEAYISAIATYNYHSRIENISVTDTNGNTVKVKSDKKLKDLPEMIKQYSGCISFNEITVEYSTYNSMSLIGVFPRFEPTNPQSFNPVKFSKTAAGAYLAGVVFNNTDKYDMAMILPEKPQALTREEAISLIQNYRFLGALELPELNTILFEYEAACFYLTYGNPCQIGDMNNMVLDIDDGFLFKYPEECNAQVNKIAAALQQYFLRWKENNYQGPIFPQRLGVVQQVAQTATTASTIKEITAYNRHSILDNIPVDGNTLEIEKNQRRSDLPGIIDTRAKHQTMNEMPVNFREFKSFSLMDVFPPFTSLVKKSYFNPFDHRKTPADDYLAGLVFNNINNGDVARILPRKPESLSREEAIFIIKHYACSGALELKDLNTIVFAYEGTCFYLTYGNPCQIGDMNHLVLNIDDGFTFTHDRLFFQDPKDCQEQCDKIMAALQSYFIRWKENDYQGALFPSHLSLEPQATQTATTASQAGFFATSSNEMDMMRLGIWAKGNVYFDDIDSRIVHDGRWGETSPLKTSIHIHRAHAEEIVSKLKQHPAIVHVFGYEPAQNIELQQTNIL